MMGTLQLYRRSFFLKSANFFLECMQPQVYKGTCIPSSPGSSFLCTLIRGLNSQHVGDFNHLFSGLSRLLPCCNLCCINRLPAIQFHNLHNSERLQVH